MTFSTITFASSKLNVACNWLASTDGALRIKGIAALVRRDVTSSGCMEHLMLNKDACGANAPAKIKRTDFNTGTSAPDVSLRTARFAVFYRDWAIIVVAAAPVALHHLRFNWL